MALIQCPECRRDISDKVIACPHCGYPLQASTSTATTTTVSLNISKQQKQNLVICISVVIILLFALWGYNNLLWSNDKVAYKMMVLSSDNFKDPSSLQLISGTIWGDKNCMFARVSANNSYGSATTSDYFFSSNGNILEEEDSDRTLYKAEDFNAKKVNKIYAKRYN